MSTLLVMKCNNIMIDFDLLIRNKYKAVVLRRIVRVKHLFFYNKLIFITIREQEPTCSECPPQPPSQGPVRTLPLAWAWCGAGLLNQNALVKN